MSEKRAVCLNCIDGRIQLPVIEWIKDNYGMDYVDMVTEPGIDGLLSDEANSIDGINRKIGISIEKNDASIIFIAAHHDCRGNPVSEAEHKEQVLLSRDRLKKVFLGVEVEGLWVNSEWNVELL